MLLLTMSCMITIVRRAFIGNRYLSDIKVAYSDPQLFSSENVGRLVTPAKKLEDTIRLAELVIEVLQQNEEHHAEVSVPTQVQASVLTHSGQYLNMQSQTKVNWLIKTNEQHLLLSNLRQRYPTQSY